MCSKNKKFSIGSRVRVGGPLGPIETITDYDSETGLYTLESPNCIGYFTLEDVTLIPVPDFEQLSLFEL